MDKKVWEYMPKLVAFVLIVGILATLFSIVNDIKKPVHSIPYTPVNDDTIIPVEDEPEPPIVVQPYYTTLPKQAVASSNFLFEQSLNGYGNIEIKNLHQTTEGLYAVVSTNTTFGDITTTKQSVAIAKLSVLGVIEKILILPSRLPLEYINSQLTQSGLAIMSKTEENILVYSADYQLNETETVTLPLTDKGRFFNTNSGCLILTEGVQNTVYLQQETMLSGFLPSGEILEIYDFYFYLLVFINTENGYSILKLSKSLKVIQTTTIEGVKAIAITPIMSNNEQMFAIAERAGNNTRLWKYSNTFTKQGALFAELGNAQEIRLFPHNGSIMAIFSGAIKGIYMFDINLDCTLSNHSVLQNIEKIYDYIPHQNGYYLLTKTSSGLCIVDYRYDNTHSTLLLNEKADNAFFALNLNNTLSAFYNSVDDCDFCFVGIIGTTV